MLRSLLGKKREKKALGLLCFPLGGQGGPDILGQVACGPLPGLESNGVRHPSHLAHGSGWAGRAHSGHYLWARPGQQRPRALQARVTGLWAGVTQQRCLHLLTSGPVTVI